MKILILGASGMLGNTLFRVFQNAGFDVWGSLRNSDLLNYFPRNLHDKLILGIDVLNQDSLIQLFRKIKPNVVINCIGIIKQQGNLKVKIRIE